MNVYDFLSVLIRNEYKHTLKESRSTMKRSVILGTGVEENLEDDKNLKESDFYLLDLFLRQRKHFQHLNAWTTVDIPYLMHVLNGRVCLTSMYRMLKRFEVLRWFRRNKEV